MCLQCWGWILILNKDVCKLGKIQCKYIQNTDQQKLRVRRNKIYLPIFERLDLNAAVVIILWYDKFQACKVRKLIIRVLWEFYRGSKKWTFPLSYPQSRKSAHGIWHMGRIDPRNLNLKWKLIVQKRLNFKNQKKLGC